MTARLTLFQQAISEQRRVFLRYHSYTRDETTERVVEPLRLTFSGQAWYLSGFCQLRQSERAFRLDRIDAWRLLDETFMLRTATPAPRRANRCACTLRAARGPLGTRASTLQLPARGAARRTVLV